jgi:hypothetical protein
MLTQRISGRPAFLVSLIIVLAFAGDLANAQSQIMLPNVVLPTNIKITLNPQPEKPQGAHGLPRSVILEPSQFNIPKENFLAIKLFELLGNPVNGLDIEFDQSYFADYYAERMGVSNQAARAAAFAAISPALAAAFTASTVKADGVAFVLARGRVNGRPFAIRSEHLYVGTNDPALKRRSEYAAIAEAALLRAAHEIADAVRPR